jgi:acyl-CoA synthetase (AMP-forming)/AMP-acid ligase II
VAFDRVDDPDSKEIEPSDTTTRRRVATMRRHDVLDYQAREQPNAEFAVHGERCLTYREALLEVHRLAHALVSAGLQIGDRVASLSKNRPESLLYIEDRITDMIVSGGENVYPHRVEEVLFQHPAIADAAVIGVPDAQWGEKVHAIVVVRPGVRVTVEELIAFCQGQLGGFERPRSVDVVAELPRNPSGKVLKWVLREPYWAGHRRRVAGA